MGADGSSTARVQRGPSEAARCASTEDHQAPSPPFHRGDSASKKDGSATPSPLCLRIIENGVETPAAPGPLVKEALVDLTSVGRSPIPLR